MSFLPRFSTGTQSAHGQKTGPKAKLLSLSFQDDKWSQGPVFDWYRGLEETSADAVAIDKLEIRKDTSSPVPHRFVMLYMRDHSVHRLDRRPNAKVDGVTPFGLMINTPVTTKDEILCHLDEGAAEKIRRTTKHEIELALQGKVDLKVVLSACFVISRDDITKNYTLFAHNCFFFSWTILMIASRRYLPYAVSLEGQALEQRVRDSLPELTTFIVEAFLSVLLDAVIDAMTIFRNTAGPEIHRGMHVLSRALWSLPVDVIRFGMKQALRTRLHSGLRERLEKQVSKVLQSTTVSLCQNALINHDTPRLVDRYLWLNQLPDIILSAVRTEMIFSEQGGKVFDAITGDGGLGDINSLELAKEDLTRKHFILGRRLKQFHAVWNAVLHGALRAARDVMHKEEWNNWQKQDWESHIRDITQQQDTRLDQIAKSLADYGHGKLDDSNRRVINFTWNAARDGALAAAKEVVKATEDKVKHRKTRDPMWRAVWEMWDQWWADIRPVVGEKMIECINEIVQKMVDVRMKVVISELGDSNVHFVMARVVDVSKENQSVVFLPKSHLYS
ncbi:hypothetical protein DFH08DRAFT_684998 [Mycena albidolilacea]|uniref:Uncharacterized protein n=1 Tax=Mycena albidolilacea TaxID=1033008 RepID=A0AAD7AKG8_9AGAR|nr:hypothetical protein DFH08DRAFT_684998 [Mycena albidolilacea]